MSCRTHILLFQSTADTAWQRLVGGVLQPGAELHMATEATLAGQLAVQRYALAILDTSALRRDVAPIIAQVRAAQPAARIIVMTASPTWARARAAFRAGAFDYVVKSRNSDEIRAILAAALDDRPAV
jgi:DNA-binding NtrC family response regulator